MQKLTVSRAVLLAVFSLIIGFLALAFAVPNELGIPTPIVTLFSPGLKIAELVIPDSEGSLAWTFSWFLRIAIGVNTAFYFAIFALFAFLRNSRRVG